MDSPQVALDLARRFSEFADVSSRFSRDIARALLLPFDSPKENSELNLRIAHAFFGKWNLDILTVLYAERTLGFQDLRKRLGVVTSRVLSRKLKELEKLDLVRRAVQQSRPPRSDYSLSDKGLRLAKLGEPVFLYLRYTEGLLKPRATSFVDE